MQRQYHSPGASAHVLQGQQRLRRTQLRGVYVAHGAPSRLERGNLRRQRAVRAAVHIATQVKTRQARLRSRLLRQSRQHLALVLVHAQHKNLQPRQRRQRVAHMLRNLAHLPVRDAAAGERECAQLRHARATAAVLFKPGRAVTSDTLVSAVRVDTVSAMRRHTSFDSSSCSASDLSAVHAVSSCSSAASAAASAPYWPRMCRCVSAASAATPGATLVTLWPSELPDI
jgi:hypothetical protein